MTQDASRVKRTRRLHHASIHHGEPRESERKDVLHQHHEPWHDYSALSFNINVPLTCCINCRFPTTISRLIPHSLWTSISKHPINQSTIATSTSLRQTRPVNVCYTYHLPSSRTSTLNFQLISNIIIEQ